MSLPAYLQDGWEPSYTDEWQDCTRFHDFQRPGGQIENPKPLNAEPHPDTGIPPDAPSFTNHERIFEYLLKWFQFDCFLPFFASFQQFSSHIPGDFQSFRDRSTLSHKPGDLLRRCQINAFG